MSRKRIYMQRSIVELEKLVEETRTDRTVLQRIQNELDHRETDRAARLRRKVTAMLDGLELNLSPASPGKPFASEPQLPGINAPFLRQSARSKPILPTRAQLQAMADNVMNQQKSQPQDDPAKAAPTSPKKALDLQMRDWTYEAVAKLRAKLIDLSRRSPLIALKHSSRSASQLRIVDERPDLLFERLNKGSMGFEPLPGEEQTPADERTPKFSIAYEHARLTDAEFIAATEKLGDSETDVRAWQDAERGLRSRVRAQLGLPKLEYGKGLDVAALARAHGFDPSYDLKLSDDGDVAAHHEDDNIRVLLTRKELERRLKTIKDRATSHLRETGHHTLHLAFGFVQWFEDDESDLAFYAPLLLMPVQLAKDEGRAKKDFRLSRWEGDLEVNVALIEKARDHWGLELPALREEETPESYFIRVKSVLDKGRRLTLRNYITLSVMPPMILWRDLDPAKWAEDAFAEHRLLPGLVGAAEISGVDGDDTLIDIDDPVHEARVPALITDADASQHRAIMDMAAGRDMSIEGPPGTGKSQTITNMIATALSQGKRVLFVAEKQAALRVVSDRLSASGFGPLLLELHGDRASRTDVYAGVRDRLAARPQVDVSELEQKRGELRRHRATLRRYLSLVRTPLGKLGKTAHALAWREVRLRARFSRDQVRSMEDRWIVPDVSALDLPTLRENRELLAQFGKALTAIDQAQHGQRTRWALAEQLDPFDQGRALDAASAAAQSAEAVSKVAERMANLGVRLPRPDEDSLSAAITQLAALTPFTCSDEATIISALRYRARCKDMLAAQAVWQHQQGRTAEAFADPERVSVDAAEALKGALAVERCPLTLSEVSATRATLERFVASWTSASRDVERLTAKLADGARANVAKSLAVTAVFADLGQANPSLAALMSSSLLDPAADGAILSSIQDATTLRAEEEVLKALVQSEAFSCEPAELDDIANILETTGALSRLFGGRYKSAHRRAVRLCLEPADRVEASTSLRRTATFLRARRTFHESAKARSLFPHLLWEGIDSDVESLGAARTQISDASAHLIALDEADALRLWLSLDATERQMFCGASQRLTELLSQLFEAGFAVTPLEGVPGALSDRIKALTEILACGQDVGLRPDVPLFHADGRTIAEAILHLHSAREEFDRLTSGPEFTWVSEVGQSLQLLQGSLDHAATLGAIAGPFDIVGLLAGAETPASKLSAIVEAVADLVPEIRSWKETSNRLCDLAKVDIPTFLEALDWQKSAETLNELSLDRTGAALAADLLKYRSAVAARQLDAFAKAASSGEVSSDLLDDLYELMASSALLRAYLGSDGRELGQLGSLSLDDARRSFKKIDKELHKLEAAAIVATRLHDKAPIGVGYGRKADFTELRLLENEIELTRPRTPLRDVVHRAGQALQALKPVWMMSPTSIAQFIKPGTLEFDLLIIDEASQMRPEFSVSCILRADQFVVVGDANQLPPSDHFQVASVDDGDDDSDGIGVEDSTESILDLANQRFRTKPRLKWHYRSQHESLIQFSNRQFYDRDLVVFPSPMANDDDLLGVKCFYAPSFYPDTVYEASINQREAQLIIEQAFGLMQTHPERSIGIVAMNAKQTELIQNEFERLIAEEESVRKYVDAFSGTLDEFFIKNLENVQGDERDIILISTVYGPDKNGVVRQNFGLMNREVGWRRLNVLVTRAKMSCRLITSLRPDDVKVTEKSSKGVIAFKSYLNYAHGGASYEDASGGETDSDFEIFVADALRDAGYEVIYQVGVENFRIDLGVRHENCPVGFIAGIECDGAPYHSGLSVRDRDHIRQTILENLGWKIYRVWSTDWFNDSARETAKLLAWLDGIRDEVVLNLGEQSAPMPVPKQKQQINPIAVEKSPSAPAVTNVKDLSESGQQLPDSVQASVPREPRGRELRSLGDFQTFEAVRGRLYEVWKDDVLLGEVEVVKRAVSAPRLYGDRVMTEQSEYEGRVEVNGDSFRSYDIYAAVREVAARAMTQDA